MALGTIIRESERWKEGEFVCNPRSGGTGQQHGKAIQTWFSVTPNPEKRSHLSRLISSLDQTEFPLTTSGKQTTPIRGIAWEPHQE